MSYLQFFGHIQLQRIEREKARFDLCMLLVGKSHSQKFLGLITAFGTKVTSFFKKWECTELYFGSGVGNGLLKIGFFGIMSLKILPSKSSTS